LLRLHAEGHVPNDVLTIFDRAIRNTAAQITALGNLTCSSSDRWRRARAYESLTWTTGPLPARQGRAETLRFQRSPKDSGHSARAAQLPKQSLARQRGYVKTGQYVCRREERRVNNPPIFSAHVITPSEFALLEKRLPHCFAD